MLERLRHRLVFATFSLVVGVAAIFSGGLFLTFELAEDKLFDSHLERDIASLMALYEHDPSMTMPSTASRYQRTAKRMMK